MPYLACVGASSLAAVEEVRDFVDDVVGEALILVE
jgi:hypothetical protein